MAALRPAVLNKMLGIKFEQIDSVQKHPLGTEVDCDDGTRRKYVRAGAAIPVGSVLKVDVAEGVNDFDPITAADTPIAGAWPSDAPGGAVTDNYFFWAVISGPVSVLAAATVVAGAPIVTIGTNGTVDDTAASAANALASGSGHGGIFGSTTSGGFATIILH